ncbi:hypothetical protein FRB90_010590 [Tulasnella sp. 427]|nr:hypothetical protein FRB90_010590 [Tulasnella sp. 427]
MEYSFTATGISVKVLGNWDHGVYSCQLDDNPAQWFSANSGTLTYNDGCSISGLAADTKHTLRVTNQPMSGWWLTLQNITVSTGDAFTGTKTFTSGWGSYQIPSNLASQTSSTVTATTTVTASPSGQVPVASLAAVAAVLGALFIGAVVAAVFFWVRDSRFRRDHQWSQAVNAAPIAYTTEPSSTMSNPMTPPPHGSEHHFIPPYSTMMAQKPSYS